MPRVPTSGNPSAQAPLRVGEAADGAPRATSRLTAGVGRAGRPVRVVGMTDLVVGAPMAAVTAVIGASPTGAAPA